MSWSGTQFVGTADIAERCPYNLLNWWADRGIKKRKFYHFVAEKTIFLVKCLHKTKNGFNFAHRFVSNIFLSFKNIFKRKSND